jgi:hypothetical protein
MSSGTDVAMRRTPGLMSVACLLVVAVAAQSGRPRAGGISPRNPQASPDRHVAPEQLRLRRNPPRAEARQTGTRAGRVREGLREHPACRARTDERLIAETDAAPAASSRRWIAIDNGRQRPSPGVSPRSRRRSGRGRSAIWRSSGASSGDRRRHLRRLRHRHAGT